jgi:hypothetical protein
MADEMANAIFDQVGWGDVRSAYLREVTARLVGPAAKPRREDQWAAFTVTVVPDSSSIVTLNPYCDLADVHGACAEVAEACLEEIEWVVFTRDPEEVPAWIRRWCESASW